MILTHVLSQTCRGVPSVCANFGKAAALWDYDAVTLTAAYGNPYFSLGVRGKYGEANRNQIP